MSEENKVFEEEEKQEKVKLEDKEKEEEKEKEEKEEEEEYEKIEKDQIYNDYKDDDSESLPDLSRISFSSSESESYQEENKNEYVIDVEELSRIVQEGNEEIKLLAGKHVVLIIGKTGVGKSSLIQMINGVKFHRVPSNKNYIPVNPELLLEEFKIGMMKRSQTKSVRLYTYNSSDEIVFCDMPGYKDTDNRLIDIATSVWISQIAKVCKTLRLVFIIHGATLEEDRGAPFRDLMDLLTNLMKNEPMEIGYGMLILFTHMSDQFNEERDENEILEYIDNTIRAISKARNHENNILMNLLRGFIKKKTGHLQVLNPVTTNISEIVNFIKKKVAPLEAPAELIQCSFSADVDLAVSFAILLKNHLFHLSLKNNRNYQN